jgi:hypothetical protein
VDGVKNLKWTIIAPVGLLALAILAIIWLDLATGGEAKPSPLLGAVGTPVRGTFVAPTATPTGQPGATPRPRPTFAGVVAGTPAERDLRRQQDLVLLLGAANELRDREGDYPTTNGNVQTLCVFKDDDVGCQLGEVLGRDVPIDPFGDAVSNGYWYASDGKTVKIYAALEQDIPEAQRCPTDNVDLKEKANLICIEGP